MNRNLNQSISVELPFFSACLFWRYCRRNRSQN